MADFTRAQTVRGSELTFQLLLGHRVVGDFEKVVANFSRKPDGRTASLSAVKDEAAWLAEKEAPAGFSIDRECELKQPDSEKATVRYARHTLDIDEVGEHVRQGKLPTQLALTWAGRVSFVLTEALTLKKIKLLDVVLEGSGADAGASQKDEGGFDADVALFTGELKLLIPELIEALGGLQQRTEVAAAAPVALAAGPASDDGSVAPWDTVPA